MFKQIDWSYLSRSLWIFGLCVALGSTAVGAGWFYAAQQQEAYQAEKTQLNRLFANYRTLLKDLSLIEQYILAFNDLQEKGLVGEERRLSWVEALQESNQSLQLPILTYTLSPRLPLARPLLKKSKLLKVYSSSMGMELGLLHEGDVLQLFEKLDDKKVGQFYVNNCTIRRISDISQSLKTKDPNFNARCDIDWVSIEIES